MSNDNDNDLDEVYSLPDDLRGEFNSNMEQLARQEASAVEGFEAPEAMGSRAKGTPGRISRKAEIDPAKFQCTFSSGTTAGHVPGERHGF